MCQALQSIASSIEEHKSAGTNTQVPLTRHEVREDAVLLPLTGNSVVLQQHNILAYLTQRLQAKICVLTDDYNALADHVSNNLECTGRWA